MDVYTCIHIYNDILLAYCYGANVLSVMQRRSHRVKHGRKDAVNSFVTMLMYSFKPRVTVAVVKFTARCSSAI